MLAQEAGHIVSLSLFILLLLINVQVTISSVLSQIGAANIAPYCASKAATTSFHESLRAELSFVCLSFALLG